MSFLDKGQRIAPLSRQVLAGFAVLLADGIHLGPTLASRMSADAPSMPMGNGTLQTGLFLYPMSGEDGNGPPWNGPTWNPAVP